MTDIISDSRAYIYAQWCIKEDNDRVGIYVKKQARLWLDIAEGRNDSAYIDEKHFRKISKILRLMIHPDLNVPMYEGLEEYAMLFIYALFCTKRRSDDLRYYETGLLEIARKNFKTFTSAVIFIIGLLTEPKFSRFFSVAPDLSLSSELQVAIKKIIKSSPCLADGKIFKLLRKEVRCRITESEFTPLAYSQDKMDGKLANMFLGDECGAMDNYPIEAMRSSQITLKEKLGIIISTQYPNDDNAMIDEIDIAKKAIDGLLQEEHIFALLYEPDDEFKTGEAWKTADNAIYQANPAAVAHEYIFRDLLKKRAKAVLYENKRENFLCKHLNIKFKGLGVQGYVEITRVKECVCVEISDDFWNGKEVYVGVDLSQSDDNTSVAMVAYHEGMIYAKVWGFIPADRKKEKTDREHVDYQRLISSGSCFECGDDVIDYGFVENFVLSLQKKYGVTVRQLGYDRWNALSTIQKIESAEDPIECVEIRQHSSVLHRPTKLLKEYILSRKFRYAPNLMLEINFQNARCTEDTNLNKYVNKKKSAGKVDMVVSLINALFLLQVNVLDDTGSDFGCQIIE